MRTATENNFIRLLSFSGTSAIFAAGYTGSQSALAEQYDGTSWTVGTGTINNLRTLGGGSGPATLSLLYGGTGGGTTRIGNTESYDGTSWTELADLATARYGEGAPAGTQTAALFFMGGDTTPGEASNATEEWSF